MQELTPRSGCRPLARPISAKGRPGGMGAMSQPASVMAAEGPLARSLA